MMKNIFKCCQWSIGIAALLMMAGCITSHLPESDALHTGIGEQVLFQVTVENKSGLGACELQWYMDGEPIAGATDTAYEFVSYDEGTHQLRVAERGCPFPDSRQWEITVHRRAVDWCNDLDQDGYGDASDSLFDYVAPPGYVDNCSDCDDDNPLVYPNAFDVEDGIDNDCNGYVDEKILLNVISTNTDDIFDVIQMDAEGPITITLGAPDPNTGEMPEYLVLAEWDGYYSEMYYCGYGDTIEVDLDPIEMDKFNGTIFTWDDLDGITYVNDTFIEIFSGDTLMVDFTTDNQGRFAIDIDPGTYRIKFIDSHGVSYNEQFIVMPGTLFSVYSFVTGINVEKPNIYLYPETTVTLDVNLSFADSGSVTAAIPEYADGWHVTVEPSGLIDGQYDYLFYESFQPDHCRYTSGWIVERQDLEPFFRENMAQTGFNAMEIEDFIEYWIPRLTEYPCYAIYPQYKQDMDKMVRLDFSVQPQSLLRLIYAIRGRDAPGPALDPPVVPDFSRQGFTVVEWGVTLR